MPQYELSLILRRMSRPETVTAIKRTSQEIFNKGGIIRSFENLGSRTLPIKMKANQTLYKEGSYFIINFDSRPELPRDLLEILDRDLDVIRPNVRRKEEEVGRPCQTSQCLFGESDDTSKKNIRSNLRKYVKKL